MSEYQRYEFLAIDRPLNNEELDELGSISTRAEITATGFTNEYNRRFLAERQRNTEGEKAARRTVGELIERAEDLQDSHDSEAARLAEAERQQREATEATSRAKYLDGLAGRQPETWNNVDGLITSTKPTAYDVAVTLLVDLRDLALRSGDGPGYYEHLAEVRHRHARKHSFITRLKDAGLHQETP
jgi:hypothetical protein